MSRGSEVEDHETTLPVEGKCAAEHLSGAGKDAMIAVEMNGDPLPARHGFPARVIVPGLYGYVSATKWITEIELTSLPTRMSSDELLALDEALEQLNQQDPVKAQVVKLRYFSGLTIPETASALGISTATAERYWAFARAWLQTEVTSALQS